MSRQPPIFPLWAIRVLAVAYWPFLTLMLLVPDPYALLGIDDFPGLSGEFGTHLVLFAVLGFLVTAAWGVRKVSIFMLGLLVAYSAATELLQHFIPLRTPDPKDFAEDVAGLVLGAAACWAFIRWRAGPRDMSC